MTNDLTKEIEALRGQIDETDDWANGVFLLMEQILPFLLRGHPELDKIEKLLQASAERYEELQAHPERAEDGETAGLYEARKILYRHMALLGVWPDIEPGEAARETLERVARRRYE
jgi:hypothetical protein